MSNQEPRFSEPAPPSGEERESQGEMLRRRAEAIARAQGVRSREEIESLSAGETRRIIHELCVHHIELELQNEELHRTQDDLEAARDRYFDLYNLAPLGYFTLDERGVIVEANLTFANLLGVARSELVDRPISRSILAEDQDIFYLMRRHLKKTGEVQSRDLRMVKSDGTPLRVNLVTSPGRSIEGLSELRCMLTDRKDGL